MLTSGATAASQPTRAAARSLWLLPGLLASLALFLACEQQVPPDTPQIVDGPRYVLIDSVCVFTVTAADSNGDDVFVRLDWDNGDTSDWQGPLASNDSTALSHTWHTARIYDVRAQARDAQGNRSDWSELHWVDVEVNSPPELLREVEGPIGGLVDSIYWFYVFADDPNSDSVCYRVDLGDGDTTDWSALGPNVGISIAASWRRTGRFSMAVQAKDMHGALSDWSPRHDFEVTAIKWKRPFYEGGRVYGRLGMAHDGTFRVAVNWGEIVKLDADGGVMWRRDTDGPIDGYPVVAADGTVYVATYHTLYAVDSDGDLRWTYAIGDNMNGSPAIGADGTVYVGGDRLLYAMNPDGAPRWTFETSDPASWASPAVRADGSVIVVTHSDVYCVNADGTPRWRSPADVNVAAAPIVGPSDAVYFTDVANDPTHDFDFLTALYSDGTRRWRCSVQGSLTVSPSIGADGTLYTAGLTSRIRAVSPQGNIVWGGGEVGNLYSTPSVAADRTVYACSDYGGLQALTPGGVTKWRVATDGDAMGPPLIGSDGTVYFTTSAGYLYAVHGFSPLADTPWPKYLHDNCNTGRIGGP